MFAQSRFLTDSRNGLSTFYVSSSLVVYTILISRIDLSI